MEYNKNRLSTISKLLDEISELTNDFEAKHKIELVRRNISDFFNSYGENFVKEAVSYYLKQEDTHPFYRKLARYDKSELAQWLGKSKSYVYNHLKAHDFPKEEIHSLQAFLREQNDNN